ncbi:unnamed protein product [Peronospora belbahrii]|uniref:LysM domain-containing protein n=1 Tax=Peronospora belbahrii TaxID=622444 RepID=A0ABN8D484_9STRA|nr:unnamed protein product [Peronospora belbahrii]
MSHSSYSIARRNATTYFDVSTENGDGLHDNTSIVLNSTKICIVEMIVFASLVASCLKLHVVSASDIIDDIDAKHVAFSQENSQTNNYINVYVELNHSTLRCRVQAGDSIPKLEGVCA